MGNTKKKRAKKPGQKAAEKRPGQVIALVVLSALGALLSLYQWLFYVTNNIVGGNSVPVPAAYIPLYRSLLLAVALLNLLLCVLLFLRVKAGFWIAAVGYSLEAVSKLLSLTVLGILLSALVLYLLFCQETRMYFRIGEFRALGPGKKKPSCKK